MPHINGKWEWPIFKKKKKNWEWPSEVVVWCKCVSWLINSDIIIWIILINI